MEITQIGAGNGWIEYKTQKLRLKVHPNAPLQCNYEIKGNTHSHCTCFPRFFCEEKNLWRCGKHKTSNKRKYSEKDTLKKRVGSIRYMTSMTLTRTFITDEQLDAYVAYDDDIKENVCAYCNAEVSKNKIDHIFPLIQKGGQPSRYITESPLNKVPCCQSCNSSKSNKEVLDWMVNTKICSEERIQKIKRRMEKVPKWDEEKYQNICNKHNIFLSLHEVLSKFCESKNNNVNDLQKEINDVLTKIKNANELTDFTSS
jgi:hypothetical protein